MSLINNFTSTVMMVRPACFGFNEETAKDNAFQSNVLGMSAEDISAKAILEFDALVKKIVDNGITVEVIQDTKDLLNPDAVFPNNWISFHKPDLIITYPMFAPKRRTERRETTINILKDKYSIKTRFQYEKFEAYDKFLEGTGSMIFDREYKIAYACRSVRTNEELFKQFCEEMEYMPVFFDANDKQAKPIYHTNVMMCIGNDFVIICMDSIANIKDQIILEESFKITGKEIIEVSFEQMNQYAGNMIQLVNSKGEFFLIMSSKAYNSLNKEQLTKLTSRTKIIHSDLTTIETYGGGSARCMIAEVYLESIKN